MYSDEVALINHFFPEVKKDTMHFIFFFFLGFYSKISGLFIDIETGTILIQTLHKSFEVTGTVWMQVSPVLLTVVCAGFQ